MDNVQMIKRALCVIVAQMMGLPSISFDEVERIYESGNRPDIIRAIDDIIAA